MTVEPADAGTGDAAIDGRWTYKDARTAVVEVTSPPATETIRDVKTARQQQKPYFYKYTDRGQGVLPTHELEELLAGEWVVPNVQKLTNTGADETHLFLFGRSGDDDKLFNQLADHLPSGHIKVPTGITDVWFLCRAFKDTKEAFLAQVRRYNASEEWSSEDASLAGHTLPPPT